MIEPGKVMGPKEITAVLKQRYPMLMLDRAMLESENRIVGVKNLCINELFFQGHFPNHPIMPGVLQLEAMRQLGELAVHDRLKPDDSRQVYMRVIEKVKFRKPILPGDRMKIEAEVLECADGEAVIQARTGNSGGLTCEAKITLAMREKSSPAAMPELYNEFDLSEHTAMDVTKIMAMVPHRYPFLLIDSVARIEGDRIIAIKNVSLNEEMFAATATDFAVLPEALQCEIIAQSGCACVLSRPENQGKLGYFMSIDRAESFGPIYPGDQLICEIVLPPSKSRFGKGTGTIRVGEREVFRITLMFAIVDA
ncbi:3-hydroxyacyl-ACP dehydratase FabZ [Victivallis sp. Marseille-Q1083]|uniref:3-hydroxyacyl-ACP dehydratase FabZ n=1 Tax=Victivallis sp. Marseille-Q1083 TaxID=2717288 RepID=UPI00158E9508|nr:3-hydroxyacyl-ACP dehydratase FabZ [Victivallis sp. Marseille-Q1083]